MSTATSKFLGEASPAGPTFSYAQAAKGRSPSVPSPLPSGKALSESAELSERRISYPETMTDMVDSTKSPTEETSVENCVNGGLGISADSCPVPVSTIETAPKNAVSLKQLDPVAPSQVISSTPPSPSFGASSTSTLPKEDELLSTANGSSDSTWDKQSQGSQMGNKSIEKEEDKEQSPLPSWNDEVPQSAPLKDAPPPAINFWQHRKEIQEAKAKTKQSAGLPVSKPNNLGNGSINSALKSSDNTLDARRQDNKKKSKASGINLEERSTLGLSKESSKATEGKIRSGEEALEKGFHRGSRTPDADKFLPAIAAPPPPPGDAISWPTPDSAQGEEKKKAHERAEKVEKEKAPAAKPHGKDKWVPVPYVPTAVFNTPLPQTRRGGRPARGGREGSTRGGSATHGMNGLEKPTAGSTGNFIGGVPTNSNDRSKADVVISKNQSITSKVKRAASAGPPTAREQKKATDLTEKPNDGDPRPSEGYQTTDLHTSESQRASTGTQTDDHKARHSSTNQQMGNAGQSSAKSPQNIVEKEERYHNATQDTHAHPRYTGPDRRSENHTKPQDYTREFHSQSNRERAEGRGDRSRGGGFRNRGAGNHGFPNSSQSNGHGFLHSHPPQHQTGNPQQLPKSQSNHERHASQSQSTSYNQSQPISRSFRSGSRSHSIQHSAPYGRFSNGPNGPHQGPPHLANLQTDLANSFGGQQGIMSAMPYNAYMEQISLFGMVSMQMEYYFSVDNLCKDMFLRKHMDSQGFVFLSVIARFNRIKQLTQETELIRYVCLNSPNIEFRMGADGLDRLRKRDGWQQWVLSKEERDPSAQNDGPIQAQQSQAPSSQFSDVPPGMDDRQALSPQFSAYRRMDEGQYSIPNGAPTPFTAASPATAMNANPADGLFMNTPLSAAVPDFAPAVPRPVTHTFSSSGSSSPQPSAFTDEQVESLMIVVRKPLNSSTSPPPFPSASSRTFSNGSIDSRTFNDELSRPDEVQTRSILNGDVGSDIGDLSRAQRSRSPFPIGSPLRQVTNNSSPVFWVKDKETPIDSLPNDLTHEPYHVFRRNALKQREQSGIGNCHRDMDILYQFWSHFLIRNFNTSMYQEFRQIAFEDAAKQESAVGIKNLIQYYDESILSQKIISDDIARDLIDLVKKEKSGTERPAFDKLRAAWRNGAFNMKNRKKIDNIIDADLKAELER